MAALSADAKTMADLLTALTHPDTNAIRQAEVALKPLLKKAECVPVLVEVVKAREALVRRALLLHYILLLWLTLKYAQVVIIC